MTDQQNRIAEQWNKIAVTADLLRRLHGFPLHAGELARQRFFDGHAEYGDTIFDKTDEELKREALEELADYLVYEAVRLVNHTKGRA